MLRYADAAQPLRLGLPRNRLPHGGLARCSGRAGRVMSWWTVALIFAVSLLLLLVLALCRAADLGDAQTIVYPPDDGHGPVDVDEGMLLTWDEIVALPEVRN